MLLCEPRQASGKGGRLQCWTAKRKTGHQGLCTPRIPSFQLSQIPCPLVRQHPWQPFSQLRITCCRNTASFSFPVIHLHIFSHRLFLEYPAGEGRHCGGAAEPAVAGIDILPCPNDQAIWLCLLWHWWEESWSALHAVTLLSGRRTQELENT